MNSKVTVAIVNWHNLLVWMTLIIHIENYLHTRNGLEFNVKKVTKTHSKVCNLSHFAVIPCESATFLLLLLFFAHDGTEHLWSAFEQLLVFHSRKQQLLIHRSARRKHLLLFICSMRNANKTRNRRQFMLKWIGIVCRVWCRLTIRLSRMEFLQLQCVQYGIRFESWRTKWTRSAVIAKWVSERCSSMRQCRYRVDSKTNATRCLLLIQFIIAVIVCRKWKRNTRMKEKTISPGMVTYHGTDFLFYVY